MECRQCNKKFTTIYQCNVHKKLHMYKCEVCSKEFYSQKSLAQHKEQHNAEYENICKLCNVVISDEESDEHWKIHSIDGKYKCLTCRRTFHYFTSFKKHSIKCEDKSSEFQCDLCPAKPFGSRFGLEDHVRQHTSEYRYTCGVCNKGFLRKDSMLVHMRYHGVTVKNHPFRCDKCSSTFAKQYNLERHALRFHYKPKDSDEEYSLLIGLEIEVLNV